MNEVSTKAKIGIVGSGTMGRGIAQVAATAGHPVVLFDVAAEAREAARADLQRVHRRLVDKGRLSGAEAEAILERIALAEDPRAFAGAEVVIEAVVEDLAVKRSVFALLEEHAGDQAILATNTSSLPVTAIAAGCRQPERVAGAHFFNPAALMPLVEVVPGLATDPRIVATLHELIRRWGKTPVTAGDTPGFIVNRVARPYYGESLRLLDEGVAPIGAIDQALRDLGGFPMGPFELMDLVGLDVSLAVTETIFRETGYDPRYRPSLTQRRLVQAGRLGRKTGRGFYDYSSGEGPASPSPPVAPGVAKTVFDRVLAMLINEAAEAVLFRVASPEDLDLAMTLGVRYPKGLLAWCDELGAETVLGRLEALHDEYGEDRYRPSALLRRMARTNGRFFSV
ncbi:MAG: 3-hydroxybutyryl-CoA dehydrogenase [Acidobacteria bacterium]|nr:3-hydroxybutyryl-CoA dehydrogenase [Acidobacteriota bacterium]